jgi:aconitate hydratase
LHRWLTTLSSAGRNLAAIDVPGAAGGDLPLLPYVLRILLENVLRRGSRADAAEGRDAILEWLDRGSSVREIAFYPGRILMHDTTCGPALVDIAALRSTIAESGGDPARLNPNLPIDVSTDHSVAVDYFGSSDALARNMTREIQRNAERYSLMKWAAQTLRGVRVHPPGTGIMHTLNLEQLATVIATDERDGIAWAAPDTLIGTDSHTPMINGLGVLGWGVGGLEAEGVMFDLPVSLRLPDVVGVRLTGRLRDGVLATDLALTVTERLRRLDLADKFVEFFGPGTPSLSVGDRAVVANMAPEYGASTGYFPIDHQTCRYLEATGRKADHIAFVEHYAKATGLWFDPAARPRYSETIDIDLGDVGASIAGPRRPQDRVAPQETRVAMTSVSPAPQDRESAPDLPRWPVAIAAITSCTNTSNPSVMIGAGLLAKKAVERGLSAKPWVKTSLAPGSRVVTDYLEGSGLLRYLEQLRFNTVGYGCTTCIGNSGPLPEVVGQLVDEHALVTAAVLSGNRNFEARIHPQVRANYLASPMLVVAFALAGRVDIDLTRDSLGTGRDGRPVYLRDIWPSAEEVRAAVTGSLKPELFERRYASVFEGDETWQQLPVPSGNRYAWDSASTYVQEPPFFADLSPEPLPLRDIVGARVLAVLGDSVTTDHISPAGSIPKNGPAARYLREHDVEQPDWNTFGSRRGNHEVMMRGTFGNVRIVNALVPGKEGNWTLHFPTGEVISIYDAAMRYQAAGTPLLILTGKEYGTGSSRDWAAKGPALLGVKAVIAESYERIHRSNLVGMGVLPLAYEPGSDRKSLGLTGTETYSIAGIASGLSPGGRVTVTARDESGKETVFPAVVRLNSAVELDYYRHGGILQRVLRQFLRG